MADRAESPRVLLLTTYYHPVIGGVETHARQIAGELHRRGFHVVVVTKQVDPASPSRELIDGVAIERRPPAGPRSRFAKWFFLPFAFLAVVRMRPRPDVIFCPDLRGIGIAAVAGARAIDCSAILQAGTPGALSCDSWDPDLMRWGINPQGTLARLLKWPLRRIYASATAYTCISREIETEARSCGIPGERLVYVPHAVDVARFRPPTPDERTRARRRWQIPDDQLVCLFVGRLSREKGVLDLLHAWDRIRPSHAKLVLVGPDMPGHPLDAGAEARTFVAGKGLASVLFAGPTDDPVEAMQAGDVFVQPSHYEAFGISALEAMATGLPIVATGVGGMRDFLVQDRNALLCEPNAPDDLAVRLKQILGDRRLRERLGESGRTMAVEVFDKDVIADTYARFFRRAVRVTSENAAAAET